MNKKMKRYHIVSISVLLITMAVSACTDNLKLEPISQISNASFWKTQDDAFGALNGMYSRIRGEAASNFFLWGEARSEVMGVGFGGSPGNDIYYRNDLTVSNAGPVWQGLYTTIHDANLLLKYVPSISFTSQAAKNNVLAQAYTMRAFVYFMLAKTWGDAIIITEPTEGFTAESIQRERKPVQEVFAQIKQDLTEAKNLFADDAFVAGRHMWSRPALNALIADVYLWTGKRMNGGTADFNTALTALNEIENSDVQLLDDFKSVFDYMNKGNKEILMAIRFMENESGSTGFEYMYVSAISMPSNVRPEVINSIMPYKYDAWSISDRARLQFTNDDQRKTASFLEVNTFDGSGRESFYAAIVTKFDGVVSGGVRLFMDDVVLYRYADVLLMKAEAKNALGQDPAAEINAVRRRAYGTNFEAHRFVSGSPAANDAAILQERLFELIFEGKRWWDLIRFGKAFELVPSLQEREGQEHLYLFPISEATLSLETKVRQNPGYQN